MPTNRICDAKERRVIALLQKGHSGRAIAAELGIAESSVRNVKNRYRPREEYSRPIMETVEAVQAKLVQPKEPRIESFYSVVKPNVPVSDKPVRVLAIGDTHDDPGLDKARFRWFGKHAAEIRPDRIIQIGDFADFESASFHSPNDTTQGQHKPRISTDIASLDEAFEMFIEPMNAVGYEPPIDITGGNHENRLWRYEEANPETEGSFTGDFFEVLGKYGVNFHAYGEYVDLAGVKFVHAPFSVMGRPIGGMNAAATIGRQASSDIVFGHTHKGNVQMVPKLAGDKVTVIDLGCALPQGYIQPYAKHTLTGWTWSIWELTIQYGRIQGFNMIPMTELERRYA